jgi:hypothetical protein
MEVNVTSPQTQPISVAIQETQSFSVTTTERINATVLDKFSILGVNAGSDKFFTHDQSTPESEWTITHNLNKRPSVVVVDSAENVVVGEVEYINDNQVTLRFAGAFSGKAYFN